MKHTYQTLTLGCFITVLTAINTDNMVQESRGSAFNNIISNYFTTDPFFKAKQKPRIHIAKNSKQLHQPAKSLNKRQFSVPSNAKQDRMSSIKTNNKPVPIRLKLGPPIQILPNINTNGGSADRLSTKSSPYSPSINQRKEKLGGHGNVVVGARNDDVVVPAPLLVATGPDHNHNKQFGNNYSDNKKNVERDNGRRQSFSQLISTSNEEKLQQKRFENFPAKDDNSKILNFKIERDAPYAYSGDSRPEMPLLPVIEKKQSPLVKFKNAEDLRYQNDYFEIPSPDDFDFENEIFDFEVPKIKPEKSMRMYEPKPQKLIKYAEPLAYMNPLDKYHKETDVEIFEVPAKPYVADKMSYSHFRSSPQFVDIDKSPSPNDYGINPINPRAQLSSKGVMDNSYYTGQGVNGEHFHEKVQDSFRGYQQDEMLEIPKIGSGPGQSFDEHVFTLPDVKFNEDKYKREIEYGRLNGKNFHNSRANDFSSQFSGPAVSKKSNYKPDNRPSYRKETSDYLNYDYNESNEYANYNDVDYNEVDYPNYPPQSPPAKPAPLPPPPGIIEMQHDAVFAGNFDVPKLGVVAEYKPPELIYDEMYQSKDTNSFSNLLPRHSEKHSRSLVVTPTPFLPTPTKPLADYSHLYKQKPYYNQYKTTSKPQKNYFKPQSSPSLTFEPEPYNNDVSRFDDHYDDRQLYEKLHGGNSYNKNFLHEIVENNLDYSEFSNPQIEEEPPMRPETMLPPPSNSYQRAELSLDNEPRFKRYPSVDYTPQDPYSYKPQSIAPAPYPAEPFIPYSDQYSKYTPPPPSPTPAPYYNPQPTQQPDYFKDQLPEFPTPDNFLHEEPDYKTPDYYNAEYYNYNDYRSPSYKSYELDTYDHAEYNDHFNNDHFVDIPKLGVDPGSMFNGPLDPASGNYNQFVNVAAPESFEHGHVRGNPEHKKQEYTRREGRHFKSQVTWVDADEGYGKHYFEFNH